ncbi:MAG: hypothetical protein RQ862_11785 [Candidatus Caldarchaeales archaeon]|jgi:type II secretory pathway component PulL|nr:hypothetical protein [Candidatus Caldarchaeales archaeon]
MVDLQALLDAIVERNADKALETVALLKKHLESPVLNDLEGAIGQNDWERAQSLFWRLVGSFLVAPR